MLSLTNDVKMIKNILNGNIDKDSKLNTPNRDLESKNESGKSMSNIGVKLDNILKEFNVLKSYNKFSNSISDKDNVGESKLNEIIKKIDIIYQK